MASAAPASPPPPVDHLVWKRTAVNGRPALYGVAGDGLPVVFLHGWGLGQHAYKRALKRLVRLGCQVFAPALPGFGGTGDLPGDQFSFDGYAGWLDSFLGAVGVREPVFLVGHSFGGGVGIAFAHRYPDRVRTLVLANSVGAALAKRPLWDWGRHLPGDLFPLPHATRILPRVLEDAVPNVIRNPRALWRVANLARKADLTGELEELKERGLPVVVLWGESDRIIPRSSFDALCAAIGSHGEVIPGNHSWLLADPDSFGEVLTNVVEVAKLARSIEEKEAADEASRAAATAGKRPRLLRRKRA